MPETKSSAEAEKPMIELEQLKRLQMSAVELYRDTQRVVAAECREELLGHLRAGRGCLVVGRRASHAEERALTQVSVTELRNFVDQVRAGYWTHAVRWTEPNANTPVSARQAVELHYREAVLILPGRLRRQLEPAPAAAELDTLAGLVDAGVEALLPVFREHQRLDGRSAWVLVVAERTLVGKDGVERACCVAIAIPEGGPRPQPVSIVADADDPDAPEIEPPAGIHGGAFAIAFDYVHTPLPGDADLETRQRALGALWSDVVPLAVGEVAHRLATTSRRRGARAHVHVVLESPGLDARLALEPLRRMLDGLRPAFSRFSTGQYALRRLECMQTDEHELLAAAAELAERTVSEEGWHRSEIEHLCATGAMQRFPRNPTGLAEVYDLWEEEGAGDRLRVIYELIDDVSAAGAEQFGVIHERTVREVVEKLRAREWSDLWPRIIDAMQNRPDRKDAVHLVLRPVTPKAIRRLMNMRGGAESVAKIVNMRLYAANQSGDVDLVRELELLWREYFSARTTPSPHSQALHTALLGNGRMNRFAYDEALALVLPALRAAAVPLVELTGTALQCHGFKRDYDGFNAALTAHRQAEKQRQGMLDAELRLGCYLAHVAIDRGQPTAAFEALSKASEHGAGRPADRLLAACSRNPYFRAVLLKATWAAGELGAPTPAGCDGAIVDLGKEWLGSTHPSESLAFWSAMVLHQRVLAAGSKRSRDDVRRAQALAHHVVAIASRATARTDVSGAKLAAYWSVLADLQLTHRAGLADFRATFEADSTATTRHWLAAAAATPDPRSQTIFAKTPTLFTSLAPLTFSNL